ncbi:unnamed protein product [Lupinus luteus]|uniref:VQ domain-containing protein n=1 Tax=Lupinus luteus TaxID=3873 RepID=A0AAV1XPS4_LUPLU
MNSVQQRTPTKRSKPKKKNLNNIKPMKVVYISNPMKIRTSATEFGALVQELTGQDAESPPNPFKFQEPGDDNGGDRKTDSGYKMISDDWFVKIGHDDEINDHTRVTPSLLDPKNYCQGQGQVASESSSMESCEPFDDVFTPQMIGCLGLIDAAVVNNTFSNEFQ